MGCKKEQKAEIKKMEVALVGRPRESWSHAGQLERGKRNGVNIGNVRGVVKIASKPSNKPTGASSRHRPFYHTKIYSTGDVRQNLTHAATRRT